MFEDTSQALRLSMQFFADPDTEVDTDTDEVTVDGHDDLEDFFEDTEGPANEETEPASVETETPTVEEVAKTIDIVHLGTKIPVDASAITSLGVALGVSSDQVPGLIQKGMNYDHMFGNIQKYAKLNNMSPNDFLKALDESQAALERKSLFDAELAKVRAKYPGYEEAVLSEMARLSTQSQIIEKTMQREASEKQDEDARMQPFVELFTTYPDLDPKDIPPEVLESIENGEKPLTAWRQHLSAQERETLRKEKEELATKLAQLEKNKSNKEKAVGSAGGREAEVDLFSEGFDSVYD